MYRKLTSLRWHTYLPADAGETFTSTLDLFFAGPFLFAKPELAKHKRGCRTNVRQLILYIQHKTPSFEKPGVRGIISLCD